jgi:hypothetical protein
MKKTNIYELRRQVKALKNLLENKDITDFPKKGNNKKIDLKNSKFKEFDRKFAEMIKSKYPKVWSKGGNIRGNQAYNYWGKAIKNNYTKGVKEWIKEREAWMSRHKDNFRIAGVIAIVKWGGISSKGEKYMKNLIKKEVKRIYNEDI